LDREVSESNLVKKVCQKLEINQKQLAEKIGVAPNTLSKWNMYGKMPKYAINMFNMIIECEEYKMKVREKLDYFL